MVIQDSTELVHITDISPNPWNPHEMTEDEQSALEQSVLDSGQWRPILVIKMDTGDEHEPNPKRPYRIIDGEHLHRALASLHLAGKHDGMARIMVYGLNSEVPVWKQQEIGQTINHGLRGSIEDPERTQAVLNNVLKYRSPTVIAQRFNLPENALQQLSGPTRLAPSAPVRTTPSTPGRTRLGVNKELHPERKAYHLALVFREATDMQDFEDQLTDVGNWLGIDRADYTNRQGQWRIDVLKSALEHILLEQMEEPSGE